jgi:hypothetical protein
VRCSRLTSNNIASNRTTTPCHENPPTRNHATPPTTRVSSLPERPVAWTEKDDSARSLSNPQPLQLRVLGPLFRGSSVITLNSISVITLAAASSGCVRGAREHAQGRLHHEPTHFI